jgi:hypothetical protein
MPMSFGEEGIIPTVLGIDEELKMLVKDWNGV